MEKAGGLPALALISTPQINGKDLPGTTAIKQQRSLWKEGLLGTSLSGWEGCTLQNTTPASSPIPVSGLEMQVEMGWSEFEPQ